MKTQKVRPQKVAYLWQLNFFLSAALTAKMAQEWKFELEMCPKTHLVLICGSAPAKKTELPQKSNS